jgi:hypothetical protein
MSKVDDIEDEFDESFSEVVRGFALMGYSRTATASILEINLSYFRQLLVKYDLHKHFKKQKDMRGESRSGGSNYWKGKKREFNPRYSDRYLLELVAQFPCWSDFMSMAPVGYDTVIRRFRMPWKKIVELAKESQAAQSIHHPAQPSGQERINQAPGYSHG